MMLATMRTTIPAAYARGIPIVAGTDTSYTTASLSSVTGEVRLLGQFGLSNLDALRAATTTAASLVGRERELGRLRPGYAADARRRRREPAQQTSRRSPTSGSSSRAGGSRTRPRTPAGARERRVLAAEPAQLSTRRALRGAARLNA